MKLHKSETESIERSIQADKIFAKVAPTYENENSTYRCSSLNQNYFIFRKYCYLLIDLCST